MPDTSPDLPPVGELVQITWDDGHRSAGTALAKLGAMREWFRPVSAGRPHVQAELVASWCRVLVLPDTDDIKTAIGRAVGLELCRDTAAEDQGGLQWRQCDGCPQSPGPCACAGAPYASDGVIGAVLSALREAAIR